jgi:hypothetical protein
VRPFQPLPVPSTPIQNSRKHSTCIRTTPSSLGLILGWGRVKSFSRALPDINYNSLLKSHYYITLLKNSVCTLVIMPLFMNAFCEILYCDFLVKLKLKYVFLLIRQYELSLDTEALICPCGVSHSIAWDCCYPFPISRPVVAQFSAGFLDFSRELF